MPRPRKPRHTAQTRQITFRLTEAEYARLEVVAGRAGLRVNELVRRLARRGRQRVVIHTTRRHDPAFIAQVRAIGINLNQLVKTAHLRAHVPAKVDQVCDEIRRLVLAAVHEDAT